MKNITDKKNYSYYIPLWIFLACVLHTKGLTKEIVNPSTISSLEWRLVGPYRGGRVTTVTGINNNPMVYYMGATGGGVWKTKNAGASWENISDGFFGVGTIGAIAVAESDNNVIYAGTGESPIRGVTTSQGDGVYKSTDAGKTWSHIGLDNAGQISRIKIHPNDPDTAYIAVQGQMWGPSEERGIFKTIDGGQSWSHVLKIGESTGASDLRMDPSNPRILYAAMWNHGRKPWYIKSGGEDGGIFKTTDSGNTWTKLEGGLPKLIGKIGIDVSASNPERIYAIIEAEYEKGGLYRSDNAGETWSLINNHRVLHSRAWYYNHITADPQDEDTVWVLNVPLMKSVDGGNNWEKVTTPHGDHHDQWINPENNQNIINGNDGGATITFDGGKTWSSIMNQPTAQFYRVITDNLFPYRIYAGQQDNSTVAILSQSLQGGIGVDDYHSVGGGESAHIAFDPNNPTLVYATTINGVLTEFDSTTKKVRSIIPYPELTYGKDARDLKYRANWNPPVTLSPHDPSIIYYGTQILLKSIDRGMTWTEISPDLTRNDPQKQGRNGGPLTPENVGAEYYNTIFYIIESATEKDTIWVGSDDGLVHLTRDGGQSWKNISPKHPGEGMINAIELSPHQDGVAYIAFTSYKLNDFKPYIYKTNDYGRQWKRIDRNLPDDAFVRVVREDPNRKGLLYAGTEKGIFVSFNDGQDWQSLVLNLPPVPITDLRIRQDNLIVATQGRAFWVLDDLFVIRQANENIGNKTLHVFTPKNTFMSSGRRGAQNFEGKNPSTDVQFYYYLKEEINDELTVDIFDSDNRIVRHFSSEESNHDKCKIGNMDPRSPFELKYPSKNQGLNSWGWNMKSEDIQCIDDIALFSGFGGPRIIPGEYHAKISIGEHEEVVSFVIEQDPRSISNSEDTAIWGNHLKSISGIMNEILSELQNLRNAKKQIQTLVEKYSSDERLQQMSSNAISNIDQWESLITQIKHQTLEDEDAWETMLAGQLRYLMDVIDRTGAPVNEGALTRLEYLSDSWSSLESELQNIVDNSIQPINDWAQEKNITHVYRSVN